jgi:uncharacterized protein YjiS (DUF1127 family)
MFARQSLVFAPRRRMPFRLSWHRAVQTVRVSLRTIMTRRGLAEMDARMLSDIGVSRADAARECSRTFWDVAFEERYRR